MIGKKLDPLVRDRIRNGDVELLLQHLEQLDLDLIKRLKEDKDETRFYQGASRLNDYIIGIFQVAP